MIRVNLDKVLKKRNKTVYWLSVEGKLAYNNLNKLKNNNTNSINFNTLETICNLLQCKIEDILEKID